MPTRKKSRRRKNKTRRQRGGVPKIPPLEFDDNRPKWMIGAIWKVISTKMASYNTIRNHIDNNVNKVLYVGMANDILTPLLAFNAKQIIAVDAIDPAYLDAPCIFTMGGADGGGGGGGAKNKKEICRNVSVIRINDISVIIENLGGSCKSMKRETLNMRGMGREWNPDNPTNLCTVEKYTIHFSFPTFDLANTKEDRELIYYIFPSYKDWLPPEAMKGIDAYISVGAPDFLHIPSHLEKVKTALTKSNTQKPYLLTAAWEEGEEDETPADQLDENIHALKKDINIFKIDDIFRISQFSVINALSVQKLRKVIKEEDADTVSLYSLNK